MPWSHLFYATSIQHCEDSQSRLFRQALKETNEVGRRRPPGQRKWTSQKAGGIITRLHIIRSANTSRVTSSPMLYVPCCPASILHSRSTQFHSTGFETDQNAGRGDERVRDSASLLQLLRSLPLLLPSQGQVPPSPAILIETRR